MVPGNDKQTFPSNGLGNHVPVAAGISDIDIDFGDNSAVLGSISGTEFLDENGDGIQDNGEPGFSNGVVYIDTNNNGIEDPSEPSATTNMSGDYIFTGLPAGTYIVRQVIALGDKQTFPANGFGNHVTLAAGQILTNVGDQSSALASISGTVFDDSNGNGIEDPGELGISGVVLYIDLDNAGDFQAGDPPTTTNSSGVYSFTGLAAGTYIVRQVLPSGDKQTFPTKGYGNHVTVAAGQAAIGANFGDKA
jgi:hypothetical protein